MNYSPQAPQGWVRFKDGFGESASMVLRDELTGTDYVKDFAELINRRLYVDLKLYRALIMSLTTT